jgi:hypothetical protein
MYRMLSDQLASQFPHPFPRDSAQYWAFTQRKFKQTPFSNEFYVAYMVY